jgi:hypothetical protein
VKYAAALAAKEARRPIAVVDVPVSVWAQTWLDRPIEVVTVGLRSLSEVTLSEITGAAATHAGKFVPGGDERSAIWAAEYSAAVRYTSLGRALCQPDCADAPWWDYPDMMSAQAFTPEGAAWLFARLETAMVGASVLASEEDPAELAASVAGLAGGAVAGLSPAKRSQVARHLRAALDVLQGG